MIPKIFDTDQHITPPKDMWTSRMPKKYLDWAPKVISMPEIGDVWSFEGGAYQHLFGLENVGSEDPRGISWRARYDQCNPAYWEPKARIEAMNQDSVKAGLFFPSVAGQSFRMASDELFFEVVRVYNEGAWDWCHQGDGKRMIPAALIPNRGVESAMNELGRVAKKGFKHYQYSGPPSGRPFISEADEPFWAMLQDSGLVLSMHGGGMAVAPNRYAGAPKPPVKEGEKPLPPIRDQETVGTSRGGGLGAPPSLAQLVFSGVLERYPKIKVGLVETSAGWYPSFIERMDMVFERSRWVAGAKLTKRPSECLANVKISIDRELQGIKHRDQIGVDNIMFGTDYPHVGSFWPYTRFYVDLLFDKVSPEETEKILWQNGASFYGIN